MNSRQNPTKLFEGQVGSRSKGASASTERAFAAENSGRVALLQAKVDASPRILAQRRHIGTGPRDLLAPSTTGRETAQRRVDPDFTTILAGNPLSKPAMQSYYDDYVKAEFTRLSNKFIDDDIKEDMKFAHLKFTLFMLNSQANDEIQQKLDELVVAVNAAADSLDSIINARPPTADMETTKRRERERREGAMPKVGTTKPMALRGVQSKAEGEAILTGLRTTLTASLGAGFPLGHVGVRGSAITGIRTRTQTPFEDGLGDHDSVGNASDLDIFFTCPALERLIRDTQNHLPEARRINAGGTMTAQYLARWLQLTVQQNRYANAATLLGALTTFQTNTEALIGRKSDVTFCGGTTAAGLLNDAGTLVL